MLSALRSDEQEELADRIKHSDKHNEGPHRQRLTKSYWCIKYNHCCALCEEKLFVIRKRPGACGAFEVKWVEGKPLLWTIHLRCVWDVSARSPAPCDGCFPFCFSMSKNPFKESGTRCLDSFSFQNVIYSCAPVLKRQNVVGKEEKEEKSMFKACHL